jgi:5-methylcytosine-specific restriction endonuclease McrA
LQKMLARDGVKYCPSCEQEKSLSAFGKNKRRGDGLTVYCRECKNRKARDKYHADPELRAAKYAKIKERYARDPEAHECQLERQRKWHREHWADPEFRAKENARHRERWRTSKRRRKKKLESSRRWAESNREYFNTRHREYVKDRYHNDPEFKAGIRNYFARRRALKRSSDGSFTTVQWEMLCDLCDNRCLACGGMVKLEVDHIVPISASGSNDLTNLQPLCRSCNASKGTDVIDYRPSELASIVEASYI